jgi:peptidyl-prolyl cis-trans isomerase D
MLDVMRRYSESFLIYLIFGAIIAVFVINFGPGSGSCRRSADYRNWAAFVDGEPIPAPAFAQRYSTMVEYQRRRLQSLGGAFGADLLERMGLRKQVIDDLIEQKLLAQEARRWGLRVSDADLRDYLKQRYPAFNEMESLRQYENWVARNFESTVQGFEADVRDEMLVQALAQVVTQGVAVSDSELKADYLREHDRAMLTYVKMDPAAFDSPPPPAAEVARLLAGEMPVVEAKYNNEVLRWRTPQKNKARQIVRLLGKDATEAEVAKARGVLLEVKSQLDGGADFAALAKEFSEDPATKDKGGELGEVVRGQLDRGLEAEVFKLKAGQLSSEPVRTENGLCLVQVTEVVEPARRALEEVKAEVAAAVLEERAADGLAAAAAGALLAELRAGKKLETLTVTEEEARENKDNKLPVRIDSAWVLKSQDSIPRIGDDKALHDEVFNLTAAAPLSQKVHKVGNGYFVVMLKERETPDLKAFDGDKDNLRRTAVTVKQGQVFRAWVQHLRDKASVELNPELFPPEGAERAEG